VVERLRLLWREAIFDLDHFVSPVSNNVTARTQRRNRRRAFLEFAGFVIGEHSRSAKDDRF
jgi:hypothetical protein